jgi:hypothetical protein
LLMKRAGGIFASPGSDGNSAGLMVSVQLLIARGGSAQEQRTESGDEAVADAEIRRSTAGTVQDQQLVFE